MKKIVTALVSLALVNALTIYIVIDAEINGKLGLGFGVFIPFVITLIPNLLIAALLSYFIKSNWELNGVEVKKYIYFIVPTIVMIVFNVIPVFYYSGIESAARNGGKFLLTDYRYNSYNPNLLRQLNQIDSYEDCFMYKTGLDRCKFDTTLKQKKIELCDRLDESDSVRCKKMLIESGISDSGYKDFSFDMCKERYANDQYDLIKCSVKVSKRNQNYKVCEKLLEEKLISATLIGFCQDIYIGSE